MTLHTIELRALEPGTLHLMLIEYVEDRALRGIEGDKLKGHAIVHLTDIDVVIEVECARPLGRDFRILKAGLGKYQCLRTHRNSQRTEYRPQIAVARFVFEFDFATVELLLQPRHGIAQILRTIVDRRGGERHEALVLDHDLPEGRAGQHDDRED